MMNDERRQSPANGDHITAYCLPAYRLLFPMNDLKIFSGRANPDLARQDLRISGPVAGENLDRQFSRRRNFLQNR